MLVATMELIPWSYPNTWLCLSPTSKLAGLSVWILWVLAGYWWLEGTLCWDWKCFVLKFSWISTRYVWTVCLDLPAAGLEGAGQGWHGWSGAMPWAMGQKHCWKKTKWSWENWQEKKERKLREMVSRIVVFALDHKARWDHLCEKTSLWRLI